MGVIIGKSEGEVTRKRICPRCGHQYKLEDLSSQVIYLTEKETTHRLELQNKTDM